MAGVRIDDHSTDFLRQFDDGLEKALTAIGIHLEGEAKEELDPRKYKGN